ncbi:hypothetical protein P3X46_002453 [Hevea brasiliensis]|uniref:Uncharacterized protein n=1 Tax=Hevea brasiliensis TaxID=3981 RepID=A0ABQ9N334_HEVBR|nr:hypothetical protein P3X46_002453 [Hevea brasiliensis]
MQPPDWSLPFEVMSKITSPLSGVKKRKKKKEISNYDEEVEFYDIHFILSFKTPHLIDSILITSFTIGRRKKNKFKNSAKDEDAMVVGNNKASKITFKEKSLNKLLKVDDPDDVEFAIEDTFEKRIDTHVFTSRLPCFYLRKLSGHMGTFRRVLIPEDHDTCLDLKDTSLVGTTYRTTIVPSRPFCVVFHDLHLNFSDYCCNINIFLFRASFGQSEAKIEAIMNDFIQLKAECNANEAETMVESTLEGFSFDSEDEADKMPKISHQTDQNEGNEEQTKGRTRGKVVAKKAAKTGGNARLATRVRKKALASKKKTKTKK